MVVSNSLFLAFRGLIACGHVNSLSCTFTLFRFASFFISVLGFFCASTGVNNSALSIAGKVATPMKTKMQVTQRTPLGG